MISPARLIRRESGVSAGPTFGTHPSTWTSRQPAHHGATPVQRWFGYLTDQLIKRGRPHNPSRLERDVRARSGDWNNNPRLVVWTKTAD